MFNLNSRAVCNVILQVCEFVQSCYTRVLFDFEKWDEALIPEWVFVYPSMGMGSFDQLSIAYICLETYEIPFLSLKTFNYLTYISKIFYTVK